MIHEYRLAGINADDLKRNVPAAAGAKIGVVTSALTVQVQLTDDSFRTDLDEYMKSIGYEFLQTL